MDTFHLQKFFDDKPDRRREKNLREKLGKLAGVAVMKGNCYYPNFEL